MKRLLILLITLSFLSLLWLPSYAAKDYVVDNADLLSDSEEAELEAMLTEISTSRQADVVVLTEEYIDTDTQSYADDYFDYNGYGYGDHYDGLILLVTMAEREWYLSTCGVCVTGFNDDALDYVTENVADDLGAENYYTCFETYAQRSDEVLTLVRNGETFKAPFSFFSTLIVCFVIGFVAALIVTLVMRGKLKSVTSKAEASDYLKQGSLNITVSRDMFLYRTISRTQKAESSSGTSHTSSSGRSHGGTGGSF